MKARRQKQQKVLSKGNDTDVRHVSVTAYVLYACCEEYRVCACPVQTGEGGGRGKGGWARTSDDVRTALAGSQQGRRLTSVACHSQQRAIYI